MRILTILLLLVTLVACQEVPVTPTEDPTPTQEVWTPAPTSAPEWDVSCVGNAKPINPVACPSDYRLVDYNGTLQAVPETMQLRITPITNGYTTTPLLSVVDGNLHINVSHYGGDIGLQIHNIYMEAGHCYTFNVPLYFEFLGASNFENYWFDSIIYQTSGGGIANLNDHPVILTPGGQGIMSGYRPSSPNAPDAVWWSFSPSVTTEVVWEFVYHANWASTGGDHFIEVDAFIIQEQFDTSICR